MKRPPFKSAFSCAVVNVMFSRCCERDETPCDKLYTQEPHQYRQHFLKWHLQQMPSGMNINNVNTQQREETVRWNVYFFFSKSFVFINVNKLCIEKLTKSIFINEFQVLQKITYLCTILFAFFFLVKTF